MKFSILLEIQYPKPWLPGGEQTLFQNVLDQVALADQLGYDAAWAVEHHFLEEYAHCSSPEVFLAAAAGRTRNIHLGHGIVLTPPGYNQPARIAERIATLDLVSNGRVEFGTGESASRAELEGYGVPLDKKRDMYLEATEQVANMLAMDPYPGFKGKYFSMPCRNVVPKPVQKPHPPMWMACSNRSAIHTAAELGLGALAFAFVPPEQAKPWIDDYYDTIRNDCAPIGHQVNPNFCVVTQCSLDQDEKKARDRGIDSGLFFQVALAHHYVYGVHKPGRVNLWDQYQSVRDTLLKTIPEGGGDTLVGTPEHALEVMHRWREAGADQVMLLVQGGKTSHEHVCQTLELFAKHVFPEMQAGEAEREARKMKELQPFIEKAMGRKKWLKPLGDDEIPTYVAYNRPIAEKQHWDEQAGKFSEDHWAVATRHLMEAAGLAPPEEEQAPVERS